jgi:hypothetical protein
MLGIATFRIKISRSQKASNASKGCCKLTNKQTNNQKVSEGGEAATKGFQDATMLQSKKNCKQKKQN